MKLSTWFTVVLGLAILAGLDGRAEDKRRKRKPDAAASTQSPKQSNGRATRHTDATTGDPSSRSRDDSRDKNSDDADRGDRNSKTDGDRPTLKTKQTDDGGYEKTTSSGRVREKVEKRPDGEHKEVFSPTGAKQREETIKPDGTRQTKDYDLGNREKRTEIVHADKSRETTDIHYNRNGEQRSRETVKVDAKGKAVSKTVVVKQNLVIKNTTIIKNTTVVRNYRPGRFGFVYRPRIFAPVLFVSWYDPYWYTPVGVPIYHPFRYSWGWENDPWYRHRAYYWEPYPIYPAPSYWVTDWMVAGYVADRYAVAVSVEQTREEVRLAREDAEKARAAAERAQDDAERAEAKAAQAAAELRAERAEARATKAEHQEAREKELAGKPNPNAKPIDKDTKEALKNQVEKTIAEKKALSDAEAKGGEPVAPDVSAALADPKHIYPVSKNLSVTRTEDSKLAGVLTAGDLLKLEPGQENTLKDATENTPINMRVITSKGEDDSVPAGTLVAIPLKELQEFDNEFRAKIDLGLTEADHNKELFKKGVEN